MWALLRRKVFVVKNVKTGRYAKSTKNMNEQWALSVNEAQMFGSEKSARLVANVLSYMEGVDCTVEKVSKRSHA